MEKLAEAARSRKQDSAKLARVIAKAADPFRTPNIGYLPTMLVLTTLPHRKPKTLVHRRINGDLTLEIIAHPDYGLPYGTYPRLILLYVCQQIVKTGSPVVDMDHGLTQAMKRFGIAVTGGEKGTIAVLARQLDALFHAWIGWTRRSLVGNLELRQEERSFFFSGRETWNYRTLEFVVPYRPRQLITVDRRFFAELLEHAVPTDMNAVRSLATLHGPFAIDLYVWLPYRLRKVTVPTKVSWTDLEQQFGADYGVTKNFRLAFMEALKAILPYYPQCKVEPYRGGLMLYRSASTVVEK